MGVEAEMVNEPKTGNEPILSVEHQRLLNLAEEKLTALFEEKRMPESHGIGHCSIVLGHMHSAIKASRISLSPERKLALCLAALLHEADDHKYFGPESRNAETILNQVLKDLEGSASIISEVLETISYVSASVNGNKVPDKAVNDPSLLWPRFCDRLEAIGVNGAVRCLQYNQECGAPLCTDQTPRPKSEAEVWENVVEERWAGYQNGGESLSMMDHYYDKLLQIAVFPPDVVQNTYLTQEAGKRVEPLVRICLEFGKTGVVPVDLINSFK